MSTKRAIVLGTADARQWFWKDLFASSSTIKITQDSSTAICVQKTITVLPHKCTVEFFDFQSPLFHALATSSTLYQNAELYCIVVTSDDERSLADAHHWVNHFETYGNPNGSCTVFLEEGVEDFIDESGSCYQIKFNGSDRASLEASFIEAFDNACLRDEARSQVDAKLDASFKSFLNAHVDFKKTFQFLSTSPNDYISRSYKKKLSARYERSQLKWIDRFDPFKTEVGLAFLSNVIRKKPYEDEDDNDFLCRLVTDCDWYDSLYAEPTCWLSRKEYEILCGRLATSDGLVEAELLLDLLIQASNFVVSVTSPASSDSLSDEQAEVFKGFFRSVVETLQNPSVDLVVQGSETLDETHLGYFAIGRRHFFEDCVGHCFGTKRQSVVDVHGSNTDTYNAKPFPGECDSLRLLLERLYIDVELTTNARALESMTKTFVQKFKKLVPSLQEDLSKIATPDSLREKIAELKNMFEIVAVAPLPATEPALACDDAIAFHLTQIKVVIQEILQLQNSKGLCKTLVTFTQLSIDRTGFYNSEVVWPPVCQNKCFRGNVLIIGNTVSFEKTLIRIHVASPGVAGLPFDDLLRRNQVNSKGESKMVYVFDSDVTIQIPIGVTHSNSDAELNSMAVEDKLNLHEYENYVYSETGMGDTKKCKILHKQMERLQLRSEDDSFPINDIVVVRYDDCVLSDNKMLSNFVRCLCGFSQVLPSSVDVSLLAAIGQILRSMDEDDTVGRRLHQGYAADDQHALEQMFPLWSLLQIVRRSNSDILPFLRKLQPLHLEVGSLYYQLKVFLKCYWKREFLSKFSYIAGMTNAVLDGNSMPTDSLLFSIRLVYDLVTRELLDGLSENQERVVIVAPITYWNMQRIMKELKVVNWKEILLDRQTVDFKAQSMARFASTPYLSITFLQLQEYEDASNLQVKRYIEDILQQGLSIRIIIMENDQVVQWSEPYLEDYSDLGCESNALGVNTNKSESGKSPFPRHRIERYHANTRLFTTMRDATKAYENLVCSRDDTKLSSLKKLLSESFFSCDSNLREEKRWKERVAEFFVIEGTGNTKFQLCLVVCTPEQSLPRTNQYFELDGTKSIQSLWTTNARNIIVHDIHMRTIEECGEIIQLARSRELRLMLVTPRLTYEVLQSFNNANVVEHMKDGNIIFASFTEDDFREDLRTSKNVEIWSLVFRILKSLFGCSIRVDDFREVSEMDFSVASSVSTVAKHLTKQLGRRMKDYLGPELLNAILVRILRDCVEEQEKSKQGIREILLSDDRDRFFFGKTRNIFDGRAMFEVLIRWCLMIPAESFLPFQAFQSLHFPSILSQRACISLWLLTMLYHAVREEVNADSILLSGLEILDLCMVRDIPHVPNLACMLALELSISSEVNLEYMVLVQGPVQSIDQVGTLLKGDQLTWNKLAFDSPEFDSELVRLNSHKVISSLLMYRGSSLKLLLSFVPQDLFNMSSSEDSIKIHSKCLKRKLSDLIKWYDDSCAFWDSAQCARPHVAVLKYCLMVSDIYVKLKQNDFSSLVNLNVTFRNLLMLQSRDVLMKVFFELNEDNFDFFSRVAIRSFLLDSMSLVAAGKVLAEGKSLGNLQFGSCFVNFILHPKLGDEAKSAELFRLSTVSFFRDWTQNRIPEVDNFFFLSSPAFIVLLRRASTIDQVIFLAKSFWMGVMKLRPTRDTVHSLILEFLDQLLSTDWNIQPLVFAFVAELCNRSLLGLNDDMQKELDEIIAVWTKKVLELTKSSSIPDEWKKYAYQIPFFRVIVRRNAKGIPWTKEFVAKPNPKKLLFHRIDAVVEEFMYFVSKSIENVVEEAKKKEEGYPVKSVSDFLKELMNSIDQETLYQIYPPLAICNESQRAMRSKFASDKFRYNFVEHLDAINWLINPTLPFEPVWHSSHSTFDPNSRGCPVAVLEHVLSDKSLPFYRIAHENKSRINLLAKFFICPEEIPTDTYNDFLERIVGPQDRNNPTDIRYIRRKLYAVAQIQNTTWPDYYAQIEIRPVSSDLEQQLCNAMKSESESIKAKQASSFVPWKMITVDQGVNDAIFINNVRCLYHIGNGDNTSVFLRRILAVWFEGLGMMKHVRHEFWPNLDDESFSNMVDKRSGTQDVSHLELVYKPLPAKVRLHVVSSVSGNSSRKLYNQLKPEDTVFKLRALTGDVLREAEKEDLMQLSLQYFTLQLKRFKDSANDLSNSYLDCFHHLLSISDLIAELQNVVIELSGTGTSSTVDLISIYVELMRNPVTWLTMANVQSLCMGSNNEEAKKIGIILVGLLRAAVYALNDISLDLESSKAHRLGAIFHRSFSVCIGISTKPFNAQIQNVLGLLIKSCSRFRTNREVLSELRFFVKYVPEAAYMIHKDLDGLNASETISVVANKNPVVADDDVTIVTILNYKNFTSACGRECSRLSSQNKPSRDHPNLEPQNPADAAETPPTRSPAQSNASSYSYASSSISKKVLRASHFVKDADNLVFVDYAISAKNDRIRTSPPGAGNFSRFKHLSQEGTLLELLLQVPLDCREVLRARPVSSAWHNKDNQRSESSIFQAHRLNVLNVNMHSNACELYTMSSSSYLIVVLGESKKKVVKAVAVCDSTIDCTLLNVGHHTHGNILALRNFGSAAEFVRFLVEEVLPSTVILSSSFRLVKSGKSTFQTYVDGVINCVDRFPMGNAAESNYFNSFVYFRKIESQFKRRIVFPWEALMYDKQYKVKLSDLKVVGFYNELCKIVRLCIDETAGNAETLEINDTLKWFKMQMCDQNKLNGIKFVANCICFVLAHYFESIIDPQKRKGTRGLQSKEIQIRPILVELRKIPHPLIKCGFDFLAKAGCSDIAQGVINKELANSLLMFSKLTDDPNDSTAIQAQRILLLGVDCPSEHLPLYWERVYSPEPNCILDSFYNPPRQHFAECLNHVGEKLKPKLLGDVKQKLDSLDPLSLLENILTSNDFSALEAIDFPSDILDEEAEVDEEDPNLGLPYSYVGDYVSDSQSECAALLFDPSELPQLKQKYADGPIDGYGTSGLLFDTAAKYSLEVKNNFVPLMTKVLNLELHEKPDSFNMNKLSPVIDVIVHEHLYGAAAMDALKQNNRAQILDWIKLVVSSPLSLYSKEILLRSTILAMNNMEAEREVNLKTPPSGIEKVLMLSILKRAPVVNGQNLLLRTIKFLECDSKELCEVCERKDKYGVRFLPHEQYEAKVSWLKENSIPYVIISENDASKLAGNSLSDESFYLRLRNHFYALGRGLGFIFVEGFDAVPDRPLKWIAELTEKYPWMFVFFVDTTHFYNWPENCDRLLIDVSGPAMLKHIHAMTAKKSFNMHQKNTKISITLIVDFIMKKESRDNRSNKYWKDIARDRLKDRKHIYLVGPPGIGKTEFFLGKDGVFQVLGSVYKLDDHDRIDCSDEELILYRLEDVIRIKVARHDGKRILIVFDEFHMINEVLRRQCIAMLERYPNVTAAFVANRIEDVDSRMDISSNPQNSEESDKCEITMCRGEIVNVWMYKIPKYLVPDQCNTGIFLRRFLELYCLVVRGLFGEELMSLRYLEEVIKIMQKYLIATNDDYIASFQSGSVENAVNAIEKDFNEAFGQGSSSVDGWRSKVNIFVEKLIGLEPFGRYCQDAVKQPIDELADLLQGKNPTFDPEFCFSISRVVLCWFEVDRQLFIPPTVISGRAVIGNIADHGADIDWSQHCSRIFPEGSSSCKCVKRGPGVSSYCLCQPLFQQDQIRRKAYQQIQLERLLTCGHADREVVILISSAVQGGYSGGVEHVVRRTLSFPEFSNQFVKAMDNFQRLHPARKIAAFVMYCYLARASDDQQLQYRNDHISDLEDIFGQVNVIDFPMRFPRLILSSRESRLKQNIWTCGVARAVIRDMSNLLELKEMIQRGYSCDWDQVRKHWARNTIVDPQGLTALLFASKDCVQDILAVDADSSAQCMLTSTERKNLLENYCELIYQDQSSCALAEQFLNGKLSAEMVREYEWLQPRFHAAWKIFLAFLSHDDPQEWRITRVIDSMRVRLTSRAMDPMTRRPTVEGTDELKSDLESIGMSNDDSSLFDEEDSDSLPRFMSIKTISDGIVDIDLVELLSWAAHNAQTRNRVKHATAVTHQVGYILFELCLAIFQDGEGYSRVSEALGPKLSSISEHIVVHPVVLEKVASIFDQTWFSGYLKTSNSDVVKLHAEEFAGTTSTAEATSNSEQFLDETIQYFPSVLLAEILHRVGKPCPTWPESVIAFWHCLNDDHPKENHFDDAFHLLTDIRHGDRQFWCCESPLRRAFIQKLLVLRTIPENWQYELLILKGLDVDAHLSSSIIAGLNVSTSSRAASSALFELALNFRDALEIFAKEVENIPIDGSGHDILKLRRQHQKQKLGIKDGRFKIRISDIIDGKITS